MRILILGINFYPELTGIGKYTGEMCAYLAAEGHEVRVVTAPPYYPHWEVQKPYRAGQYRSETWKRARVYRCPLWVPRNLTGLKRVVHLGSFTLSSLLPMLMQIGWRPQLVIGIAPAIASAPVALLVARLCGSRAWLHIQDFELDAAFNLGLLSSATIGMRILAALEHYLVGAFDTVSTISDRMCERLLAKGVASGKIVLFPNWVDTEQIYPLDRCGNPFRQLLGLQESDTALLYSGNMGQKQGLEIIVEAARLAQHIPHIHFVLSGEGSARSSLVAMAEGLSNVHFLPIQPQEELNSLLNLADIHLLPQRADAADLVMPSKLTGMLASGRPVIATAHADTEIGHVLAECGVLAPPGDAHALIDRIAALVDSPEEMARLGRLGREYAVRNLDRQGVLARFTETASRLGQQKA